MMNHTEPLKDCQACYHAGTFHAVRCCITCNEIPKFGRKFCSAKCASIHTITVSKPKKTFDTLPIEDDDPLLLECLLVLRQSQKKGEIL